MENNMDTNKLLETCAKYNLTVTEEEHHLTASNQDTGMEAIFHFNDEDRFITSIKVKRISASANILTDYLPGAYVNTVTEALEQIGVIIRIHFTDKDGEPYCGNPFSKWDRYMPEPPEAAIIVKDKNFCPTCWGVWLILVAEKKH